MSAASKKARAAKREKEIIGVRIVASACK